MVDFSAIKTYSAFGRVNLVKLEDLIEPRADAPCELDDPDFLALARRIAAARRKNRPVILSMGAHVIKGGLSRCLIELMRRGFVTHIAGNGAASIHDFELAYLGGTSEDVPHAIEDGSFGMWEETGRWMNEAIQGGAKKGKGYGESLGAYIAGNPEKFPHAEDCVVYNAYKLGVPATYHVAIGTDIIHQHPIADFGAIGAASGEDFRKICGSVAALEDGVFLNFGSAVIGPEVFLKALSIARNLGNRTFRITTANFDLRDLGDYRVRIASDDPDYYYRPRKNIVNRPTQNGGLGWHFVMDHKRSLPNLLRAVVAADKEWNHGENQL